MDNRRKAIKNSEQFVCKHIEKANNDINSEDVKLNPTRFTAQDLTKETLLPPDVLAKVNDYSTSTPSFEIFELTDFCFAVKTAPSNFSCIDFVHVTKKPSSESFKCARGSGCDRFSVTVAKKTQHYSLCSHEHIINIVTAKLVTPESVKVNETTEINKKSQQKKQSKTNLTNESIDTANKSCSTPDNKQDEWLHNTSVHIFRNMKIDLSLPKLRSIEKKILKLHESGFPSVYSPNLTICPVCKAGLSPPSKHRNVVTSNLLTRDDYKIIHVLVQNCAFCKIMFQPHDEWYLNIGDTLLVTTDIVILLQNLVHGGAPLSTVANTLIFDVGLRSVKVEMLRSEQVEWMCRLLTLGFLAFEALGKTYF